MNIVSALKCLLCLIKCSKYLYYIKKVLCFTFVFIALVTVISVLSGNKCITKKLKEMM